MAAVNRHQRHDNAEPNKVNENRQEDDQQGGFSHESSPTPGGICGKSKKSLILIV